MSLFSTSILNGSLTLNSLPLLILIIALRSCVIISFSNSDNKYLDKAVETFSSPTVIPRPLSLMNPRTISPFMSSGLSTPLLEQNFENSLKYIFSSLRFFGHIFLFERYSEMVRENSSSGSNILSVYFSHI